MHVAMSIPLFVHIYYSLGQIKTTIKYEFKDVKRSIKDVENKIDAI